MKLALPAFACTLDLPHLVQTSDGTMHYRRPQRMLNADTIEPMVDIELPLASPEIWALLCSLLDEQGKRLYSGAQLQLMAHYMVRQLPEALATHAANVDLPKFAKDLQPFLRDETFLVALLRTSAAPYLYKRMSEYFAVLRHRVSLLDAMQFEALLQVNRYAENINHTSGQKSA